MKLYFLLIFILLIMTWYDWYAWNKEAEEINAISTILKEQFHKACLINCPKHLKDK